MKKAEVREKYPDEKDFFINGYMFYVLNWEFPDKIEAKNLEDFERGWNQAITDGHGL